MTRVRGFLFMAASMCAILAVSAASAQTDPNDAKWAEKQDPVFNLKVSPRLLAQGIDLLIEKRLKEDYNMDDFQAEEMRQLLRREIPQFLQKHQTELETLASEWLEAVSGSEPPTAEFAAEWASRLRPIVGETSQMIERVGDGMREFLDDDQMVLLDGYLAGAEMVTQRVNGQLYKFEQGEFNPVQDWPGNRDVRRRAPDDIKELETQMTRARDEALGLPIEDEPPPVVRQELRQSCSGATSGTFDEDGESEYELARDEQIASEYEADDPPPPQPDKGKAAASKEAPKHEWEIYVEQFIVKYSLNPEQQQKARLHLQQAMEQRERHLTRNGARMEQITRMFEIAKTDKQRQTAEKAYASLLQPLDRILDRLKSRLDSLPTRKQRQEAALSGS